ncbi:MAG TPA: prepilin-type N-terminal cleavage/methylation domain-containing protein [Sulfurovum sp.]|nr:prepilin-type N-terminal cleavage/methylation domain-containing protein [Sulfurovum sp.]
MKKQKSIKYKHKRAFTLIEVIVAVVLVAIVVMGSMDLQSKNQDMAMYIVKRGKNELDNSLFLTSQAYRYDKDEKDAYSLIRTEFDIKDEKSKVALKSILKKINITEDEEMPVKMKESDEPIFTFYTNEVLLKGKYPARYYNFK